MKSVRISVFVAALMVLSPVVGIGAVAAAPSGDIADASQQRRPRVQVTPRNKPTGPNSVRQCRAQLVQEPRLSGTVIVPKMYCWWE